MFPDDLKILIEQHRSQGSDKADITFDADDAFLQSLLAMFLRQIQSFDRSNYLDDNFSALIRVFADELSIFVNEGTLPSWASNFQEFIGRVWVSYTIMTAISTVQHNLQLNPSCTTNEDD